MDRNTYFYIAGAYNAINDGQKVNHYIGISYKTDMERNPSGIPTMGTMEGLCRRLAGRRGSKYMEGSFAILNIMRLTKRQFERLQSGEDNSDREFPL